MHMPVYPHAKDIVCIYIHAHEHAVPFLASLCPTDKSEVQIHGSWPCQEVPMSRKLLYINANAYWWIAYI